jgi:hypothetical protein
LFSEVGTKRKYRMKKKNNFGNEKKKQNIGCRKRRGTTMLGIVITWRDSRDIVRSCGRLSLARMECARTGFKRGQSCTNSCSCRVIDSGGGGRGALPPCRHSAMTDSLSTDGEIKPVLLSTLAN